MGFLGIDDLWVVIAFFVFLTFGLTLFIARTWLVPWNKAAFLRLLTRKNWVLIEIRRAGGQRVFYTRVLDAPFVEINGGNYHPVESAVNYKSSVPLWSFNEGETDPILFKSTPVDAEKFRDPKHLNAAMLLQKALAEALANEQIKKVLLFVMVVAGLCVLLVVGEYVLYQRLDGIEGRLTEMQNASSYLVNQIR